MDNLNHLKDAWKAQKSITVKPKMSSQELLKKIQSNSNNAKREHLLTIAILSLTAPVIGWFFLSYINASHWSITLGASGMVGCLIVRALLEIVSLYKFNQLSFIENAQETAEKFKHFYLWRKKIHGNVTLGFYTFYSLSFLFMAPMFVEYLGLQPVILIVTSFELIILFLAYFTRMGIRREMKQLISIKLLSESFDED